MEMERSTDGSIRQQLHLPETGDTEILTKGYSVGSNRDLPSPEAAVEEYPQVSTRLALQSTSCLTCEACGKLLGSGKDPLDAVISASAAGMITVIKAIGFWYETRHFCVDCGRKKSAKPLRVDGFVSA